MTRRCCWLALILCGCVTARNGVPERGAQATALHVAVNGSDQWSGRLAEPNAAATDGPFASLTRARDEVRRIRRGGPTRPVRVVVRAGVYELRQTLRLTREDSGTARCPVTWQAAPGERVVIRGGRAVGGWKRWRDGIWQADLEAQDVAGAVFCQLFYRGKRQVLARHPNLDPEHPRTGGFVYAEARGPRPREQFAYEEDSLPFGTWGDIPQAEIVTVFGRGWNFAITPVLHVDTKRRIITTRRVRRPFEADNRFFVRNVLGALDAPGEWFLDRKKGILYFWPPDGAPADGQVVVPLIDHLIEIRGTIPYPHGYLKVGFKGTKDEFPMPADAPEPQPVEHISIRGFRLECARQDAVRLVGARHCAVVGCTVTNVGGVGINLGGVASAHQEVGNPRVAEATGFSAGVGGGGQNLLFNDPCQHCRVAGNDVWAAGSDGVFLYGTANVAENNHVYHTGLFDKDCACINVFGEANAVRRNTLHDVPRNAVFLKGTDNVVELNDIHHTMLETCDGGAIRMCQRNLAIRGNVIRFNRIVDTVGYGYPAGRDTQSPYYSWGVYLDDFTCGTTVRGNIIVRTGRGGVHVHGGSDNLVENNVIVDAGLYQFENNPIRKQGVVGNVVRRNVLSYDGTAACLYRCGRWLDGAVTWEGNVVWCRGGPLKVLLGGGVEIEGWDAWLKRGAERGSVVANPQFRDPASGDYRLTKGSPAWRLGFVRIPVEQIGCHPSEGRASWPLRIAECPPREKPVLRKAPVRPLREDFEWDVVGRPPRRGTVRPLGRASIRVTDKVAASGKHSLEFVDAPGLANRWQPRIYYGTDFREGTVRFSCDLRLDAKAPPDMMIDFRQYSDAGGKEYLSGPMLSVSPRGELAAGGKVLMRVPFGTWFHIELTMPLGAATSGHHDLTVTVRGAEPKRFRLARRSPAFHRLERIVIMSNTDGRAVFHMDNVACRCSIGGAGVPLGRLLP